MVLALALAFVFALVIPFLLARLVPVAPATVKVAFTVMTSPQKFLFSWERQVFDVCEYPTSRAHRILENIEWPRKQCTVIVEAGSKEIAAPKVGTYWVHFVQTGKKTLTIEPLVARSFATPQQARDAAPSAALPEGAMNFNMYDFEPKEGVKTIDHGRPLANPHIYSTWQFVTMK
jgi:hypothetical protein